MESVLSILKYALQMEKNGENFYRDSIQKTDNPQGRAVLESLADMEVEHQEFIQRQIDSLTDTKSWSPIDEKEAKSFNKFNGSVPAEAREASMSDIAIYRLAYLIENDLANLYKRLAEKVDDPEGKKICLELAKWEEEHLDMLNSAYKGSMENNWYQNHFSPF